MRALLALSLAAGFVLACGGEGDTESPPEMPACLTTRERELPLPSLAPLSLAAVKYWAYQLQELSVPGAVEALVDSHYDLLVLEPTRTDWSSDDQYFDTRGMVARVKSSSASDGKHRKLILAYVNITEAEDWRWYWTWSRGWRCRGERPDDWPRYILACDPDGWAGDYPVAYWDAAWKDVLIYGVDHGSQPGRDYASIIDEAVQDGFDGIYLDWVAAFEEPEVARAARQAGLDPEKEMVTLIREIRAYAATWRPGFLIAQQNGVSLVDGNPELLVLVDAVAQEAVWFDGEATDDWDDRDGYDQENDEELTTYYLGYMEQYADVGLPVFVCEYALEHADLGYEEAYTAGLVPYVTRTPLSRLTTTVPPGY